MSSGAALAPEALLLAPVTPSAAIAQAATPAGASTPQASGPVHFGDGQIEFAFDAGLRSRVRYLRDHRPMLETQWGCGEFLERAGGGRIDHFARTQHAREPIAGVHGAGERFLVVGLSREGVEKTVDIRLFERYPGFAFVRVGYRNRGAQPLACEGWTNGAYACALRGGPGPEFWSYSGGTYPDRRDWVQPLKAGFSQDNFLGMTASDYGGGNPIVDIWRRDGGLAVGHVDARAKRLGLPLAVRDGAARIAVRSPQPFALEPGAGFETLETFVAVHGGDYFATLDCYRRVMADRGLQSPAPPQQSYAPIWCAWGYERDCSAAMIEATLPKAKDLGLEWAVIDDGWQSNIGDWGLDAKKYPGGDADMKRLAQAIRAAGLKPRLWFSPLSVAPGADLLHDHPDMLLLDKDGAVQNISWWNSFYLCPAYAPTRAQAQALVRKFIGQWGFAGLKIDGQHLNGVAPCFNPAHRHARPEESSEGLAEFFHGIFDAAREIDPDAVIELCPCGTAYAFHNMPYMNHAPASDPESSWQVRHKGKTLKALMGPAAAYAGDHVELSQGGADFASTVGVGGVVSTKFTWPLDPKPKDSFLLTPEKETTWRKWIGLYREKMLPSGLYRGELYDIGFDKPEAHAVEKDGKLYYAFYAVRWKGVIELRGLGEGAYRVRDYVNDRDLGVVSGARKTIDTAFEHALLLEAVPA